MTAAAARREDRRELFPLADRRCWRGCFIIPDDCKRRVCRRRDDRALARAIKVVEDSKFARISPDEDEIQWRGAMRDGCAVGVGFAAYKLRSIVLPHSVFFRDKRDEFAPDDGMRAVRFGKVVRAKPRRSGRPVESEWEWVRDIAIVDAFGIDMAVQSAISNTAYKWWSMPAPKGRAK